MGRSLAFRHLLFVCAAMAASVVSSASIASAAPPRAECPPGQRAAIDLANEADRLRMVDLDGAIAKYQEAVALEPTLHRIHHKLALAQSKKESWEAAAKADETAAKLAPTFAIYFAGAGRARSQMALREKGPWQDARTLLEKAVALDPGLSDAHYELAEVLLHMGDEHGALVHYSKAVETNPAEVASWAALADLYVRLGYLAQAEKTLREALESIAGDRRFVLESIYGDVLSRKGDRSGSLAHYEEARKSCGTCGAPGQAIAFFNLGAAYASIVPPRKSEAIMNLQMFHKMICKGAAYARYADQCHEAQALVNTMGGALQ